MGRLALLAGTGLIGVDVPDAEPTSVGTSRGTVRLLDAGTHVLLQRHGTQRYRPPHLIDHAANLAALTALGCDRILAVSSVGGLRPELPVGTFLCPHDFIALQLGVTAFDDERGHQVPGFAPRWRERVLAAWKEAAAVPLRDGGVYWQAIGPRLETPAEVRMIAVHADVVGMTVASECVLACEAGVDYAAVCVVDNAASGTGGETGPDGSEGVPPAPSGPLTMEEVRAGVAANRPALLDALAAVLPRLAE
jgi:5'-methylthioadenosine phosphorylase